MRTLCLGILALTLSCGGATKNPATTAQAGASPQDEKLGEYIARHGGLPSLGGPGSEPNAAADSPHLWLVQRPVKLDGVLDEWPARAKAKETLHGDPGARVGLSAAIQYDATNLYVGGEVTDDRFTRTARFGADEDYASLVLAFPIAGGRFATYEVGLFAGKPGESAGSVRALSGGRKGAELAGARIVEAPTANGYTFEASLPWSAFPEARTTRVGLRGAVRYHDADGSLVATGGGDVSSPTGLPSLPSECEQAMIDQILAPRGLISATPRLDTIADVVGDTMKERILAFDRVLLVCGPGYLGGGRFFFRDLGGELVRLDVRDVTGRGKQDLLVRRRATLGSTAREYLDILSFFGDQEEPRTTFAHEISVASGGRRLSNAVRVSARQIEVSVEPASNWDQASYREPLTSDAEPILFPWGAVTSRSYRFDGTRFVRGREVTNPIGSAPPPPAPRATVKASSKRTPKASDLSYQLLEQIKRDRGIAADEKPWFDLEVNVADDPREERVVFFGRELVVFGPGFKGGKGYVSATLSQFADTADIHEVNARDLTGDGAAEIIVRGVRRVTANGQPVELDVLFVYAVRDQTLTRVFGIETGREQAGKRVQGLVQFVPGRTGFEIDVRPGRAIGWTEQTYPWPQEPPGGTVEPLLLPWGGIASLRYAWNGSQFARQ